MNEYRMTRNDPYFHLDKLSRNDLTCRQGYYLTARNKYEAFDKMKTMYPNDIHGFTCQLWKENINYTFDGQRLA